SRSVIVAHPGTLAAALANKVSRLAPGTAWGRPPSRRLSLISLPARAASATSFFGRSRASRAGGGSLPLSTKTRSLAHLYETMAPVKVVVKTRAEAQNPAALCQFQSLARPLTLKLGTATALKAALVARRGNQRYRPDITRNRKKRLAAPVTGLPMSRAANQRCHSSTKWRKSCI